MRVAVCPGSFDPVTNGHVDIFERSAKLFDKLYIAVFHNPSKNPWFTIEERMELLAAATKHIPNIEVAGFDGLLTEYCFSVGACAIVRGLRALSDFEYEFQRALMLKKTTPQLETLFLMTANEYSFVSSSNIKELAHFGGDLSAFAPKCVVEKIALRHGGK